MVDYHAYTIHNRKIHPIAFLKSAVVLQNFKIFLAAENGVGKINIEF